VTAAATTADVPSTSTRLPLALTIAMRELRAGASGLVVFVLCIALGVAAVAAIGSLAAAFDKALANQGRLLIGGDLSFEVIHRQANSEELAALKAPCGEGGSPPGLVSGKPEDRLSEPGGGGWRSTPP
jgi:putative ABC transport system permease protein